MNLTLRPREQTLGNGLLFQVNRNKSRLEYEGARRKALWTILGIALCIGISLALWLKP